MSSLKQQDKLGQLGLDNLGLEVMRGLDNIWGAKGPPFGSRYFSRPTSFNKQEFE